MITSIGRSPALTNTRPPDLQQSPEWGALHDNGFEDFRLEVGGVVREPRSFSLAELKAIAAQDQITMHTCMQGWTGIAKWSGVPLREVLAQVEPLDGANYVMIESFGTAQHMHDGRPVEPYYTVLTKAMAMEDETILAWGMNGQPLPDMYGAPLRLRTESMHGYKMVKWIRSVSWIHDLAQPRSARAVSRSSEARSLSAVVARARGTRFSSVSCVQS